METPNYYAIITANVRYSKNINANEKLLFAEITALSNKTKECWASNNYFAILYNVTPQAISKWIKNLEKNGFITIKYIYKQGTKEIEKRILGINDGILGINDGLGGYQHTIKDNNTSINNKHNNSIDSEKVNHICKNEYNFSDDLSIAIVKWMHWRKDNGYKRNINTLKEQIKLINEVKDTFNYDDETVIRMINYFVDDIKWKNINVVQVHSALAYRNKTNQIKQELSNAD